MRAVPGWAALPGALDAVLLEGEADRVVLVLLDALGWAYVARHAAHPLLARFAAEGTLEPLASQFPSTTTAHVTTLHTGLGVGEHGLYEWRVLEPSLGRIVKPLPFTPADDHEPGRLAGLGLRPADLLPAGPTRYERLAARGVAAHMVQPSSFAPSTFDGAALRGAGQHVFDEVREGFGRALALAAGGGDEPMLVQVYWDRIDTVGHGHGPSSAAFDGAIVEALDALQDALAAAPAPRGRTLLVLTADHGHQDVRPDRCELVLDVLPGLEDRLVRDARGRPMGPAGSSRDLFLHVAEEHVARTVAELGDRLDGRATVHACAEMVAAGWFGPATGGRLAARLGSVCVLPGPGGQAWTAPLRAGERARLGQHGGRTSEEATAVLGTLRLS